MEMLIFFAVLLGIMAIVIVVVLKKGPEWAAAARKAHVEKWTPYAQARGFTIAVDDTSRFGANVVKLQGQFEGVPIVIDSYSVEHTDSDGHRSSETFTRVNARASAPLALRASFYREHALSGLGSLLGFQDVKIGDPAFDAAYVVKASDEGAVRYLCHPGVRQALLALPKPVRSSYEQGVIEISWKGLETEPTMFDAACRVASALATPARG